MAIDEIPVGLRHNKNWHRLVIGQGVSVVGDFVFDTTVLLWVATVIAAHQAWAPAAASGVLIAAAIPVLVIGPIAGVYVDRWDRRRTMLATDLIRAGVIGVLLLIPLVGTGWPVTAQLTLVYVGVALASAASQFFNPSRFAIIGATVARADQPRAFGIFGTTSSAAAVIGPPLAAPLLFGSGVKWALIVDLLSFLVSFASVLGIRLPARQRSAARERPGFWLELKEGLVFFGHNRQLTVLCGTVCIYMFGVGAINVLNVFFVHNNLHSSSHWLGTLSAGLGVGAIVGALLAARMVGWLGETRVFSFGVVLTGLIVLLYSRLASLPAAIVVLALAGIPLAVVNVVLGPLILRATPSHLIGRVSAVMNPLVYLASILSMAVAGFLASGVLRHLHEVVGGVTFGPIDAIFGVSALLMITAGLVSIRPLAATAVEPAGVAVEEQAGAVTP